MEMTIQPSIFAFDYSIVSADKRQYIQGCASQIKTLAKRSAEDMLEIGRLLTEVKSSIGHGNFGNWLESEFGWAERTAENIMRVYAKFANFADLDMFAPSSLYLLSQNSTPEKAIEEAVERAEGGEYISHQLAKEILDNNRTDRALYSSNSNEWYTPNGIILRVIKTMGGVDTDPCSNSHDNPTVPATTHYTFEDDGLSQEWHGRVYMNPPYGREIADWVEYLFEEYKSGRTTEAIALVPSRTDTAWFRVLRDFPHCFIWGRLNFSDNGNAAPFPSMAVYLGDKPESFIDAFKDIGDIYVRIR